MDALMEARRVLGYAAIGLMISAPFAANAREGLREVGETDQVQKAVMALDALNRGFMPDAGLCRVARRELNAMAHAMAERGDRSPAYRG